MKKRLLIRGVVQGVGFRPFVYRIAKRLGIRGYVRNRGNSVEILAIGDVARFINRLREELPPLAEIHSIEELPAGDKDHYDDFLVLESSQEGGEGSVIPPDVAICDACLKEMFDPGDRRYMYPFTVCTDCGPRFAIIEALPYDRENTTMRDFSMCDACAREYRNPEDRRFHAEPIACPKCGPSYELYEGENRVEVSDVIREAARLLDEGYIVAIMGLGGTHLAAKVTEDEPIERLRRTSRRPEKPFAIMARDIEAARLFAHISEVEEKLLLSAQRPIVLLRRREDSPLSPLVAPGLSNVGIMLPYTGVHHLLFHYSKEPAFIMTSANVPGEPMAITREDVLSLGYQDYSLVHNRRIRNRIDDSVLKLVAGSTAYLRRSRGYVPLPIELNIEFEGAIIALGAEENVAGCVLSGKRAFLTQYIGDTKKLPTLEFLRQACSTLMELNRVDELACIARDLHPEFATSKLAEELASLYGCEIMQVQHHHAHIAALMAESGEEELVGIAIDGFGYGEDGSAWGGEVLYCSGYEFSREAHLEYNPAPGGDLATRYPLRMLAGMLHPRYSREELIGLLSSLGMREGEANVVVRQLERGFNVVETSSMGRVLDAIAALLGVCRKRTYEGEPAIKLEAFAVKGKAELEMPVEIKREGGSEVLNTSGVVAKALEYLREGERREDIAASAQAALAEGIAMLAVAAAERQGVEKIGVTGGVAYNDAIVRRIKKVVEREGFTLVQHRVVPPGDGGIALGQCYIAAKRIEEGR
jgi:hydrogenase maturation protein HypF